MRKVVFLSLLLPSVCFGAQSKTYPTSPVTTVRVATYMDAITTIFKSSWTIPVSTWTYFGSTPTYINPMNINVQVFVGTGVVKAEQWPLDKLINYVVDETKNHVLNEVVDQDMEIYMVWPASSTTGLIGPWNGRCRTIVNGNPVYVACP